MLADTLKPSFVSIGDITITPLCDGHLDIPAAYFSNISDAERDTISPTTRFGANSWLIECGHRTILVDAGAGETLKSRFPETGQITAKGPPLGQGATSITDIIVTHMHADHIGGLIKDGNSLFPEATIHLQEREWAFWTDETLPGSATEDRRPQIHLVQDLARPIAGQVKLHSANARICEGVEVVLAPGHTHGHQIVHISSGRDQAMLLGDAVVSGQIQFTNPEAHYALDSDPETAVTTRKKLFEELAADQIPFTATHLDTPCFGRLHPRQAGGGYWFEEIT